MNQKPDKLVPSIYGGVIMALISAIPFLNLLNCLCCAGVMVGGFLAVFFYKNNFTPETPPFTSSDCMGVGALAGVIGAILGTILSFASLALFGNVMGEFLMNMFKNMNIDIPAEAWEAWEESMSAGVTPVSIFIQLILSLVIDTIFGLLGGLIAYSVYKPKNKFMQTPMPPPIETI